MAAAAKLQPLASSSAQPVVPFSSSSAPTAVKAETVFMESVEKCLMQQVAQTMAAIKSINVSPSFQHYEEMIRKLSAENGELRKRLAVQPQPTTTIIKNEIVITADAQKLLQAKEMLQKLQATIRSLKKQLTSISSQLTIAKTEIRARDEQISKLNDTIAKLKEN